MNLPLTDDDKLGVAARFAAATRTNDPDAYAALCAPGAVTWHNYDDVEVTTEQTTRSIGWLHRTIPDLSWVDVALLPTPAGFVSQMIMTGTAPGGALRVNTCVIATLNADGLITRLEEYLDPGQTAVLRA